MIQSSPGMSGFRGLKLGGGKCGGKFGGRHAKAQRIQSLQQNVRNNMILH
jgi:hypothetical protein